MAPDVLDEAIARVEAPAARTEARIGLMGRQDRLALLNVPADITDIEWLSLVGAMLQIGDGLRAQRPAKGIELARVLPMGGKHGDA